ncbi:interleukin-32-like [Myotis yumanensis]|uniref:interleukin-32-like n=1 Tax=Myotis yumanensis TaxID=159337 RepID=UPI0038CFEBCF
MCYCKTSKDDIEKMRSEMLKAVNNFCDKVKPEEEDQVNICLEELGISISEATFVTLFAHCENNQKFTSLLLEQQQELRNRVLSRVRLVHKDAGFPGQKPGPKWYSEPEGSHNQRPGAQKPGESFCERVLRLLQKMLSRLQKMWQDLLAWVQEKWASFVSVVKSIWSEIKDFFSSVAQYFSS